ncbi:MAG TPA: 3'-5' exonuclease [Allosphingosinicella sp.]|jgi:DNA polymerase-3 subunit epsilon
MNCSDQDCVADGDAGGDIRVLRRLEVKQGFTGEGEDVNASVCAVVDVETTGLDHENDAIIQLALRRFRYDADGVITRIDRPFSWLEDPGRPIPPEITDLTGIRDADVAGRSMPDQDVIWALTHCTIVVAHNAAFDRKWIERRFPDVRGAPWACSMADVEWERHGYDGRKLGFLGVQCGFFFEAHRADVDVDAVIALLRHRFDNGRTAMSVMMQNAEAPSWIVRAGGAAFERKERLRARGYRWNPQRRVWAKEVRDADRPNEECWLATNIYAADARPRASRPSFKRRTRWDRYA